MTNDESKTLVFIYDREVTEKDSADERILTCRQYACDRGWTVAGQWVDRGSNAVALRRTFWNGMIAAMEHEGRGKRIVCLVANWHRIAFDDAARNTLRQTVSHVGGACVAVDDEAVPSTPRDVAMRRLHAGGEQLGPGTTLVRHDGETA
ncbi:recombinase family protein [Streptomyces rapamycinicus]|uniref:Resolvase/invertase-type recombinase catalytic domain-containing protein n=2 Tax=Streptomyces rapamycinicus TaxID=1226757 RepID=A0A0A0N7U8_STRRN|nr:recombinase family protein [Streptomyces rapamycinicus]AGP53236.1 hypothetical protein M271_08080 [Streptomyces rapamycinicus NRRL 5491]MBB4780722.1 hypothetical protein [Streptomyces rapamycinicus]RLV74628.1 hypothetical protein D3C57_135420 [Streptomyces rapamycinicus NRRL 5491]UTO61422.1 recombinase family protein [Streptomyces rapamycinicus]UTP29369.1 recombinase family protein [Streptomyces rapamycinicus NRRL 5491]